MALAIENRYATALFDVVSRPASETTPQAALEQLESFADLLKKSAELRNVLSSPAVAPTEKRALVERFAERLGISRPVRNFLFVAIDNRRIRELSGLTAAFEELLDKRRGLTRIAVTSAAALDEDQRREIIDKFQQVTGNSVRARFAIDEALLGGARVRIGSTVYDGSLSAQIGALSRSLAGRG